MSDDNWRTAPDDAAVYFGHQKKRVDLERRRPVVRKASDLVGPGINAQAVRVDDLNDILATFNGYYSALAGTPNAPTSDEPFVGHTISDLDIGGRQVFTGLVSNTEYSRTFTRNPTDPESILWGLWTGARVLAMAQGFQASLLALPERNVTYNLTPPALTFYGDGADCFTRLTEGVRIKKPGIYTGHIQVGSDFLSSGGNVGYQIPDGDGLLNFMHLNQIVMPSTVYYPFTFRTTSALRVLAVTVLHDMPNHINGVHEFWYRLSITRLGDAT